MKDRYVFPAVFSFDSDGISIEFLDLPGCLTFGMNEDEALTNAKEALELHLYGMEEDGEEIPNPTKINDIAFDKGQAVVLIEAWLPPLRDRLATKSINKMLTIPKWLNDLAEKEKLNFSQILQSAVKERLGVYDYHQLRSRKRDH